MSDLSINNLIKTIERLNQEIIMNINTHSKEKISLRKVLYSLRCRFFLLFVKQHDKTENFSPEKQTVLAMKGRKKCVVYSCVLGDYDIIREPYYYSDNIDYIMFTDSIKCNGWKKKDITEVEFFQDKDLDNSYKNRFIKFHPYDIFGSDNYDYAIYLDGNIAPISDLSILPELVDNEYGIAFHKHCSRNCVYEEYKACFALKKGNLKMLKRQIKSYKIEGMPKEYGLVEGNVIVTNLKNGYAKTLYDKVWNEMNNYKGGRDQICWSHIFWKENIDINRICSLGKNVYANPKFRYFKHYEK